MNTDFLALLKVMRWFYRDKHRWEHGEFDVHGVQYAYLVEPWESICLEKVAADEGWDEDDWWDKAYGEVAYRHELIVKTEYEPLGNVIFSRVLDGDAAWGMSVVIVRCGSWPAVIATQDG